MKNKDLLNLFDDFLTDNDVIDIDNLTSFLMKVYKSFKPTKNELKSLESWGGYTYTLYTAIEGFRVMGHPQYCDPAYYCYKDDFESLKNKCEKYLKKVLSRVYKELEKNFD